MSKAMIESGKGRIYELLFSLSPCVYQPSCRGQIPRLLSALTIIGVIVRNDLTFTAVHLVAVERDDTLFNDDAVNTVLGVLGNGYQEAIMLGHIQDIWLPNFPEIMARLRNEIINLREM